MGFFNPTPQPKLNGQNSIEDAHQNRILEDKYQIPLIEANHRKSMLEDHYQQYLFTSDEIERMKNEEALRKVNQFACRYPFNDCTPEINHWNYEYKQDDNISQKITPALTRYLDICLSKIGLMRIPKSGNKN